MQCKSKVHKQHYNQVLDWKVLASKKAPKEKDAYLGQKVVTYPVV
jgi:hypothetical protein